MSKEELSDAYSQGRISRRAFAKGIAALGGALGAGILLEGSAGAQAKKVAAKKGAAKKPTTPPGLENRPS